MKKLTLRRMWAMTAGTGTVLVLGSLAACGASSGTGSISPSGTTHGTFRYCSYTPDDDGIEISHHASTPCLVGDVRSKKDRKRKKATPSATAYVPVHPTSTATGHSAYTVPTAKTTSKAPKISPSKHKPKKTSSKS